MSCDCEKHIKRKFFPLKEYEFKDLKKVNLDYIPGVGHRNTKIYRSEELEKIYNRKNLCLKVFNTNQESLKWGTYDLFEATVIQNLHSIDDKAPRVYDIILANGKVAQVTDYLKRIVKKWSSLEEKVRHYVYDKGEYFKYDYLDYVNDTIFARWNFIKDKLIDFEGIEFKDFNKYHDSILKEIENGATGRAGIGLNYQIKQRNIDLRWDKYKIENLKDKVVLDIGCNLGLFCQKAIEAGAKRVIGIDTPKAIESAKKLAYADGYFNIDFYSADLNGMTWEQIQELANINEVDIIFFFAMSAYMGEPEWLNNCETLYFEGHRAPQHQDKRLFYEKRNGKIIREFYWENY